MRPQYDTGRAREGMAPEGARPAFQPGSIGAVRADASLSDRSRAVTLRGEILNALHRLRASLSDEIKEDDTLPRDLEARVFAFFDLHA